MSGWWWWRWWLFTSILVSLTHSPRRSKLSLWEDDEKPLRKMTTQAGDGDANDYEERCLHEQTCAWHPQPREVHEPLWSIASRFKICVFHYVFQHKYLNICVSFNISSTVSAYTCRTHSWLLWRDPDRSCRRCAQKPVRQVNKQLFKLSWLPKSPASNLSGLGNWPQKVLHDDMKNNLTSLLSTNIRVAP